MSATGILASVTVSPSEPPAALRRLRPPAPAAPREVVHRSELPTSTWTGLHLDGALVPLWRETSRIAGVAESSPVRALAFAHLVPRRGVVGRLAAVWVHAGGAPPQHVTVLVRSGARRPDPHPGRTVAEADLGNGDVVRLGAVAVTSVLRTGVDVARWVTPDRALPALRALQQAGLQPEDALRRLGDQAGGRGVRAARHLLAGL